MRHCWTTDDGLEIGMSRDRRTDPPRFDVTVDCDVHPSFRVEQVAGLFDVAVQERMTEHFSVDLPESDASWQIGCIVGPSGSGKSTIARAAFGKRVYGGRRWAKNKAVIDCFPDVEDGIKTITAMLTSVGFSSPPSWVKPYSVLSTGEQFRCDLAYVLLQPQHLVVFDEFTSVVDRTVAQIGSMAVAKAIRRKSIGKDADAKQFVAVTCHYDVIPWLQPDWVVDMANCQLARGCLQRPELHIKVFRCTRPSWKVFARHHYLTGKLHPAARCYGAFIDDNQVGFCATIQAAGHANMRRMSRLVILPDYQGVGIGAHLATTVAAVEHGEGYHVVGSTNHPGMLRWKQRSPHWKLTSVSRGGSHHPTWKHMNTGATRRAMVSFEWVGPSVDGLD